MTPRSRSLPPPACPASFPHRHGGGLRIFAMDDSGALGRRVCGVLGVPASLHAERSFDDGEHESLVLCDVGGCDVFVLQCLHGDGQSSCNDKLCRLLFFLATLKDAGAARVTAVLPYLVYARKDRRQGPGEPLTTRALAALFEASRCDAVMAVDVHNLAAFQNAFRCATWHMETAPLFAAALAPRLAGSRVSVLAPDAGAIGRATALRQALSAALCTPVAAAFAEKYRHGAAIDSGGVAGEVAGHDVVIIDDMIATGATLARAVDHCHRLGACRVFAVASHALLVGDAVQRLCASGISGLMVSDSVPPLALAGAVEVGLAPVAIVGLAPAIAANIMLAHAAVS